MHHAFLDKPAPANGYQHEHAGLLIEGYRRWTGRDLVGGNLDDQAKSLFEATFAVVSHDTETDPVFTYGNCTALALFELDWRQFVQLPSRKSAQPVSRQERARLLAAVSAKGFIDDYSGVRISATGKLFRIENATVWNLVDEGGAYRGQAAHFDQWVDI